MCTERALYRYPRGVGYINHGDYKMLIRTNLPTILRRELHTSPLTPFDKLFDEMLDSVFPKSAHNSVFCGTYAKAAYPKVNVVEENDKILMEAAVPGLTKKDITLEVEDNTLTISADKQDANLRSKDGVDGTYLKRELHYSSFRRSFEMTNLDHDKITASVKDGILRIEIPKLIADDERSKKIRIT